MLCEAWKHFHPVTGFAPDILLDLLEGIVPVELCLCLQKLVNTKYFTFDYLNNKTELFPYNEHTDKTDKPHPIPKTCFTKGSVGGNGRENATLLRLSPLMVGSKVPEEEKTWAVLMDLKYIVELSLSPAFTEETIQYLQCKTTGRYFSEVFFLNHVSALNITLWSTTQIL